MSNNITIKNINDISRFCVPATAPKDIKESIVDKYINPSKYEFLGFLDRTNAAILRPRYHNVRDSYGRFARVEETI